MKTGEERRRLLYQAPDERFAAQSRPQLKSLPVTVAIPAKNESLNLAKCLERLSRFAEVIVIDSGSTDDTKVIAERFGARVIEFQWDGRYPKKRNWFLLNGFLNQPWVLFLDADEFVDDRFCNALADALQDTKFSGFWLTYRNVFLGRELQHGVAQRKLALFRAGSGLYERIEEHGWSGLDMEIHEHPVVDGEISEISASIEHRDYKGLPHFLNKHCEYAQWEARRYAALRRTPEAWQQFTGRQRFKYRYLAKWWYAWLYFFLTYVARLGFLDGAAGFHYAFYKLWYFQTIRLLIRTTD